MNPRPIPIRRAAGLLLCIAAAAAQAAGMPPEVPEQRARIARERAAAEALFSQREQECQQRFAVTACVDAARAERRTTLERLTREQLEIDDGERKRRAAERMDAIETRQRAVAAQLAASRASAAAARQLPALKAAAPKPRPVKEPADTAAAQVRAAERAAARARREQAAARHRAEVEERLADPDAQRKAAKPLPLPASR